MILNNFFYYFLHYCSDQGILDPIIFKKKYEVCKWGNYIPV